MKSPSPPSSTKVFLLWEALPRATHGRNPSFTPSTHPTSYRSVTTSPHHTTHPRNTRTPVSREREKRREKRQYEKKMGGPTSWHASSWPDAPMGRARAPHWVQFTAHKTSGVHLTLIVDARKDSRVTPSGCRTRMYEVGRRESQHRGDE